MQHSGQTITPVTDEEAQLIARATDVDSKLDWDSTSHDKVVERENAMHKAREFIGAFRACVELGMDRPIEVSDETLRNLTGAAQNEPIPDTGSGDQAPTHPYPAVQGDVVPISKQMDDPDSADPGAADHRND